MEWFEILAIILVVIVIIIIITAIIIVAINAGNGSTGMIACTTQNDCPAGYVCSFDSTVNKNICKVGLGLPCGSDSDCAPDLICVAPPGSSTKICTTQPPTNTITASAPIPVSIPVSIPASIPISTPASTIVPTPIQTPVQRTVIQGIYQPVPEPKHIHPHMEEPEIPCEVCQALAMESVEPESTRKPTPRVITQRNYDTITPLTDSPPRRRPLPNPDPPTPKRPLLRSEISSLDTEHNSDGSFTDAPFDIRSAETSVSTPCEEKDGTYYCRPSADSIDGAIDHSAVIDVCSYSNAIIFLLHDGNIICEITHDTKKQRTRNVNNISLKRITSFQGYLYGMSNDGKLYMLPNNSFATTTWLWDLVNWAPTNISHISTTHNGTHLWLQTTTMGYLYEAPEIISLNVPISDVKRVYGRDSTHYLDIHGGSATLYPGGKIISNIVDGALSYYDEVIAIQPNEINRYKGITIVNWHPYYIRT